LLFAAVIASRSAHSPSFATLLLAELTMMFVAARPRADHSAKQTRQAKVSTVIQRTEGLIFRFMVLSPASQKFLPLAIKRELSGEALSAFTGRMDYRTKIRIDSACSIVWRLAQSPKYQANFL